MSTQCKHKQLLPAVSSTSRRKWAVGEMPSNKLQRKGRRKVKILWLNQFSCCLNWVFKKRRLCLPPRKVTGHRSIRFGLICEEQLCELKGQPKDRVHLSRVSRDYFSPEHYKETKEERMRDPGIQVWLSLLLALLKLHTQSSQALKKLLPSNSYLFHDFKQSISTTL